MSYWSSSYWQQCAASFGGRGVGDASRSRARRPSWTRTPSCRCRHAGQTSIRCRTSTPRHQDSDDRRRRRPPLRGRCATLSAALRSRPPAYSSLNGSACSGRQNATTSSITRTTPGAVRHCRHLQPSYCEPEVGAEHLSSPTKYRTATIAATTSTTI